MMKRFVQSTLLLAAITVAAPVFSFPQIMCGSTEIKMGDSIDAVKQACGNPDDVKQADKMNFVGLRYTDSATKVKYRFSFMDSKLVHFGVISTEVEAKLKQVKSMIKSKMNKMTPDSTSPATPNGATTPSTPSTPSTTAPATQD